MFKPRTVAPVHNAGHTYNFIIRISVYTAEQWKQAYSTWTINVTQIKTNLT